MINTIYTLGQLTACVKKLFEGANLTCEPFCSVIVGELENVDGPLDLNPATATAIAWGGFQSQDDAVVEVNGSNATIVEADVCTVHVAASVTFINETGAATGNAQRAHPELWLLRNGVRVALAQIYIRDANGQDSDTATINWYDLNPVAGTVYSLEVERDSIETDASGQAVGTLEIFRSPETASYLQVAAHRQIKLCCPVEPEPEIPVEFTRSTSMGWNHNNNGGTSNAGTLSNNDCISSVQDIVFGPGVSHLNNSTFEWVVTGVDTNSKADAKAAGDYVEFPFTVGTERAGIASFYHGLEPQRNSTGAGDYNYCLEIVQGATSVILLDNEYITEPQTGGDNGPNTRVNKFIPLDPAVEVLDPNTAYTLRMYLWSAGASGPTGSALFPNTNTTLPAGTVAVDDVSIGVECE